MKIGKIAESVLKRSVLRQLKTKRDEVICGAGVGDDCAIFSVSGGSKVASCVQSAPVFLQKDITIVETDMAAEMVSVSQLMQKAVNNIVVSGATPFAAMVALLLPTETEEPVVKELMKEAEEACAIHGVQIMGGQTEVSAAVNYPVMTVTLLGCVAEGDARTAKSAKAGQDIVISKWIGLEGTAVAARVYKQKLLKRYPAYLVEEAMGFDRYLSVVPEAATAMKSGVCAMHDASEGGILAALWELAEGAGVGLTIELKKLPLRQETVEVCELCNLNPYELKSGGCLVMTAENGEALAEALRAEGIPAVVVGRLTDSNDRIILNEEEVRYMDRPRTDEIYKINGLDSVAE